MVKTPKTDKTDRSLLVTTEKHGSSGRKRKRESVEEKDQTGSVDLDGQVEAEEVGELWKQKEKKARPVEEKGRDADGQTNPGSIKRKDKDKKKKRRTDEDNLGNSDVPKIQTANTIGEEDPLTKHPTILKKFQKLLRKKTEADADSTPATAETQKDERPPSPLPQGLVPIPQPLPTKVSTKPYLPLSSSLPTWAQSADTGTTITVAPTHSVPLTLTTLPKLLPKLYKRLTTHLKYTTLFAVQTTVIPLLLLPLPNRSDLLVSAPTGSGKTLSYILPILNDLSSRIVPRLRAVIVVPTRELVTQVRDTTESLASGLKVGVALGSRSLKLEQGQLMKDNWAEDVHDADSLHERGGEERRWSSKVDILICTPGRLVEHITATPGFSLKYLRWLVVDEADRLLAQSFQEWVGTVMGSLESRENSHGVLETNSGIKKVDLRSLGIRETTALSWPSSVTKVILSATMTKDAGKLSGLKFRKPKLIIVEGDAPPQDTNSNSNEGALNQTPDEIFTVPPTLREHYIPLPAGPESKPLLLEQLLRTQNITSNTLIFTKSNENAARLARLMELLYELDGKTIKIGLVSGEVDKWSRKRTLAAFQRREIDMLICSDLVSRGLDIPLVGHIINYDVPSSSRAYVHRVGRTARAGNTGDAWSLVADNEARWFWKNIGKVIRRSGENKSVHRLAVEVDETQRERYEAALERLGVEVRGD